MATEDFIEKVRRAGSNGGAEPRNPYILKTWGFDPDTEHCGWAVMITHMTPGQRSRPLYWNAGLIQCVQGPDKRTHKKGLDLVQDMITAINGWSPDVSSNGIARLCKGNRYAGDVLRHKGMIEGQEFYSNSNVNANDLIHLGQVAGALYAKAVTSIEGQFSLILPRIWKGNKQKPGMHARIKSYLESTGQGRGFDTLEQVLKAKAEHALDALCMAGWLMGQDEKVPMFG